MRMRFDVAVDDDDRAFAGARSSLLAGFEAWLTERGEADATGLRDDAAVFVDWRYGFSTGELDRYDNLDIREYLLSWCPRNVSGPPAVVAKLAGAVDHFVHYLAATDRLEGGTASADELASSAAGLVPKAKRALANPDRHGMTKTTLMVVRDTARLVDGITSDELPSLDDLVAQFGAAQRALPAEVEAATTDENLHDIADASTEELLTLLRDEDVDGGEALAAWRPDLDDDGRIRLIVDLVTTTDVGAFRMIGVSLFNELDPSVCEPYVRDLLDSQAAGHAALWLIGHGLTDPDDVEHLVGVSDLVDAFSATLAVPEYTAEFLLGVDDPYGTLDEMSTHDAPETAPVLAVLAEHVQDRRLADAARKAHARHRRWMAGKSN